MGLISSKFLKLVKECEYETSEYQKDARQCQNAKSSTSETPGTSAILRKKFETDRNVLLDSDPLKSKLLKTLKLDPRSPTVGIHRTPILVEDSIFNKTLPENCDSPISIYSCNINDSFVQGTPVEPSVNVSDFENSPQKPYDPDNILKIEEIPEAEGKTNKLTILDKPNTYEARQLLDEITMSNEENFLKKVKLSSKKGRKYEARTPYEKKIYETKVQLKSRYPLSNITSSTNSPNKTILNGKNLSKNKVIPDFGIENSSSPKVKHLAQWDQNNTLFI